MPQEEITERDRFPLLDERGRRMLDGLRQHPHAPKFNYHCGEKLTVEGLQRVRDFAGELQQPPAWSATRYPDWLLDHVRHCWSDVPYFRQRDQALRPTQSVPSEQPDDIPFNAIPFTDRHDLRRQPWSFVPDSADLSELIVYSTSGTTGNLLPVICDPSVPASYLPLFELALAEHGLRIDGGERVSILHMAAQRSTYTLMSAMSYFGGAGFAKINLNPAEWRTPEDREAFIDDCNAEIYTGDPFAYVELSKLKLRTRPKAILSSATALLPAVKEQLESRFQCPVIDVYSMNETGPIAYTWRDHRRIFPHRLYVEIVDAAGQIVANGELGEIVVTGGINPWMPLLRYRTGDMGALEFIDGRPALVQLQGRTPVDFFRQDGSIVRSIDVTVALFHIPLPVFRLHQHVDGSLRFSTLCNPSISKQVSSRLEELFGSTPLAIEQLAEDVAWEGKSIQYTSEFQPGEFQSTESHSP
ncbi:MAG: AMP-binding protein [Planctomycetota bacterium]